MIFDGFIYWCFFCLMVSNCQGLQVDYWSIFCSHVRMVDCNAFRSHKLPNLFRQAAVEGDLQPCKYPEQESLARFLPAKKKNVEAIFVAPKGARGVFVLISILLNIFSLKFQIALLNKPLNWRLGSKKCHPWGPQVAGSMFPFTNIYLGFFRYPGIFDPQPSTNFYSKYHSVH